MQKWTRVVSPSRLPCRSLCKRLLNQGLCVCGPKAANHICQSSRGWCGATTGGAALMFPGLYMNSISCKNIQTPNNYWTQSYIIRELHLDMLKLGHVDTFFRKIMNSFCKFGTPCFRESTYFTFKILVKWYFIFIHSTLLVTSQYFRPFRLFFIFTFTFMHLADAFIQSDLQYIQCIHLHMSVHVFPGNRTHNLCAASAML